MLSKRQCYRQPETKEKCLGGLAAGGAQGFYFQRQKTSCTRLHNNTEHVIDSTANSRMRRAFVHSALEVQRNITIRWHDDDDDDDELYLFKFNT